MPCRCTRPRPNRRDIQQPVRLLAAAFPISIKGVLFIDRKVVMLRNEREEWELPGGRPELGETPEQCVARELREELSVDLQPGPILDSWFYEVLPDAHVFIVTYGFAPQTGLRVIHSYEHKQVGLFAIADIPSVPMPDGYKRSVIDWARHVL